MFVVSFVNLLHIHISTCPQNNKVLKRFNLSVVVERTVTFLTTVDVVLEVYNNCLQKITNDWVSCVDSIWVSICWRCIINNQFYFKYHSLQFFKVIAKKQVTEFSAEWKTALIRIPTIIM